MTLAVTAVGFTASAQKRHRGRGAECPVSDARKCREKSPKFKPSVQAERKEKPLYDFDYIARSDGWLASYNAAGLHGAVPVPGVSYAEAYFGKQNGRFINYWESDDSYDFGLKTESFRRFEKVSFYGKMQYRYFRGQHMSGSILLNPGDRPFDLVEFTPGTKTREQYILSGGVGFLLTKKLTGGLRIDYEADNYAKRKDLRHSNTMMDLNLSAGFVYRFAAVELGANYLYRKNTERVLCEQIGTTGGNYDMFFNKGVWFGEKGLWTGNGMHLNEPGISGLPMKDSEQGAALQIAFRSRGFRFFNEFTYRYRKGETGEKGTIWTHSGSDVLEYRGVMSVAHRRNVHLIRGNFRYVNLKNNENVLRSENIGGVVQTVIYGSRQIYRQRAVNAGLEYEFDWKADRYNPVMSLRAGADYYNRSGIGSLVFPYTRSQYVENVRVHIGADRNFRVGRGWLKCSVELACHTGGGSRLGEGRTASSVPGMDPGAYAAGNEEYRNYEYEYLAATRGELSLGVRYTRPVGRIALPVYGDLGWSGVHAGKLDWVAGRNRSVFALAIGCQF